MRDGTWKRRDVAGGLLLLAAAYAFLRRRPRPAASQPEEIAPGVWCLETGHGFSGSNVYFVRSGPSWVLIDAAWPNRDRLIRDAAESLFGAGARPAAILLTHVHPDHSGSAAELAQTWGVPVYVHPLEMASALGKAAYSDPIERWLGWLLVPLMSLVPRRAAEPAEPSLADSARSFDPSGSIPGLPDWECVPTPGHTPGHVAFFRPGDRVLITGDAVLPMNLNSLWDLLRNRRRLSGPPYISTWNWTVAKESVAALARLDPNVLACGHGAPLAGPNTAADLRAFAAGFSDRATPAEAHPERP